MIDASWRKHRLGQRVMTTQLAVLKMYQSVVKNEGSGLNIFIFPLSFLFYFRFIFFILFLEPGLGLE